MQKVLIREATELTGIEVWFSSSLFPDPVEAKLSKLPFVVSTASHVYARGRCIIVYLDPRYDKEEALVAIEAVAMGEEA